MHTRSAKTRRALPGGVRHGYHHASHHRTCHSAGWRRRLVRPGPLVLSNETRCEVAVASARRLAAAARKRRGSWRRCRSWPSRSGSDSRLGSPRHRPRPRSRTNNRNQGARAPRPRYNSHQGAREGTRSQGDHRSRSQLKTYPGTVSASSITASSSPELGPFLFSGVSRCHENPFGREMARAAIAEYRIHHEAAARADRGRRLNMKEAASVGGLYSLRFLLTLLMIGHIPILARHLR